VSTVREQPYERLLINVRQLTHVYRTSAEDVVALRDFNLQLTRSERVVAVVGPSGSGKTTLLKVLAGLEKPMVGAVWVDGHNVAAMSEQERDDYRRRYVGYAWQEAELSVWPQLTSFENVLLPMLGVLESQRERRERAAALLDAVGLGRRLTRLPPELSYGDNRRLALAVALANHPRLLLADEVTAGLDDEAADQLLADLKGLLRRVDASAIIVAHGRHLPHHVDRIIPLPYPRTVAPPTWRGRTRLTPSAPSDSPRRRSDVLIADRVSRWRPSPDGPLQVIRNMSLRVSEGEMVAVLGGSGTGKSTLLALCSGLEEVDTGRITIAGQRLTDLSRAARQALLQRKLALVLHSRPPIQITPVESVALAARICGCSSAEADRLAKVALAAVGLQERATALIGQLSGGEQVRLALARALTRAPALLIADEPTAQLDVLTSMDIIELLREAADSGTAVLLATHSPVLAELADRVLVMSDGTLREVRQRYPKREGAVSSSP
jgi:ABC-type lipoprotein export system ATPase subunit